MNTLRRGEQEVSPYYMLEYPLQTRKDHFLFTLFPLTADASLWLPQPSRQAPSPLLWS